MATPLSLSFEFKDKRWTDAAAGLQAFYGILEKDFGAAAETLSREMREFLTTVTDAIAERNSGGWPGGTTEGSLSRRTGTLNEAILNSVEVTGSTFLDMEGSIGAPGIPYASIQETGGTIKAKSGKMLAIPLPAAMTTDGVSMLRSPRDWPNTFVRKSKAGNLIIFMKLGDRIVPLYVLKPSVTIPARLGMQATLEAGAGYFVDRAIDSMVKAVTQGAD